MHRAPTSSTSMLMSVSTTKFTFAWGGGSGTGAGGGGGLDPLAIPAAARSSASDMPCERRAPKQRLRTKSKPLRRAQAIAVCRARGGGRGGAPHVLSPILVLLTDIRHCMIVLCNLPCLQISTQDRTHIGHTRTNHETNTRTQTRGHTRRHTPCRFCLTEESSPESGVFRFPERAGVLAAHAKGADVGRSVKSSIRRAKHGMHYT